MLDSINILRYNVGIMNGYVMEGFEAMIRIRQV